MDDAQLSAHSISVEIFAAKDSGEVVMTVPWKCGLRDGDTLLIKQLSMVAMRDNTMLPIDLPALTEEGRLRLVEFAARGKRLPVGEFLAVGLANGYFVNLVMT